MSSLKRLKWYHLWTRRNKKRYSSELAKTNGVNFDIVRQTSFLKNLPRVTFARIVKYLRVVEFAPGEEVIREGEPGDSLFIIQEGTLEVYQGVNNDRHVLGLIKEGHTFGEMALLTHDARRSASVMALSPARLIEFTRDGFEKMIFENPSLYPTFVQSIIDNLNAVNDKYCQVADMFTSGFEKATQGDEDRDLLTFIEKIMVMPFFSTALCQDFIGEAKSGEMLKRLGSIPAAMIENNDGTNQLSAIFKDFILSNAMGQQPTSNLDRSKLARILRNHLYFRDAAKIFLGIKEFEDAAEIVNSQLSKTISPEDEKFYRNFLSEIPGQFLEPYPALRNIIPSLDQPTQDKKVNLQAFGRDLLNLNTAYDQGETPPKRLIPITKILGWGLFIAVFPTLFTSDTASSSFIIIAICAIILWSFELVDLYMVTIFLLVCSIGKNVADREIIFSGFTSSSFFLTLGIFGLSSTFISSGLVLRMALRMLAIVPFRPMVINFTLAFIGVVITPVLPSANGRLALISPILLEMMDSVGYRPNSPCTRRIAMSTMTGFGLTSCLFLTGKPIHLAVHGMLPAASGATFTWGFWFLAALVPGLMIFSLNLLSATLLYKDSAAAQHTLDKSLLNTQLQSLGRLSDSTREIHVILAIMLLLGGAMTSSIHGLGISWFAMLSMLFLMFTGGIDKKSFKSKIDWPFLFFLAGIISFVRIFNHLGLDEQISGQLVFLKQLIDYNILLFLVALSLIVFMVRFLLPSNVTIVLLSTILIPIAVQTGISPWIPCFTIIVASNVWFRPYQCTFNLTFYSMTAGQLFQHRDLTYFLLINALIAIAAIAASVPVWKLMGLL